MNFDFGVGSLCCALGSEICANVNIAEGCRIIWNRR